MCSAPKNDEELGQVVPKMPKSFSFGTGTEDSSPIRHPNSQEYWLDRSTLNLDTDAQSKHLLGRARTAGFKWSCSRTTCSVPYGTTSVSRGSSPDPLVECVDSENVHTCGWHFSASQTALGNVKTRPAKRHIFLRHDETKGFCNETCKASSLASPRELPPRRAFRVAGRSRCFQGCSLLRSSPHS
jgi:hypothetical protein